MLVIQACKSETMKVKITEMISPLYEFCLQQFTRNKVSGHSVTMFVDVC